MPSESITSTSISLTFLTFVTFLASITYAYETCGRRGQVDSRIIGGVNAAHGEFPWMISLRFSMLGTTAHVCGGSLIGAKWVVTAAHCFNKSWNPSRFTVRVGDWRLKNVDATEKDFAVAKIVKHEKWNYPKSVRNDIALVELKETVDLRGPYVGTVCLPDETKDYRGAKNCTLTGWGYTSFHLIFGGRNANYLQKVTGAIWNETALIKSWGELIGPGMIGFGYDDSGRDRRYGDCKGDSGGPLVCLNERGTYDLVGIVSWGTHFCVSRPGVLSSTAFFHEWIEDHVDNI